MVEAFKNDGPIADGLAHSSATGLRVYFDATGNPSRLNAVLAEINPD